MGKAKSSTIPGIASSKSINAAGAAAAASRRKNSRSELSYRRYWLPILVLLIFITLCALFKDLAMDAFIRYLDATSTPFASTSKMRQSRPGQISTPSEMHLPNGRIPSYEEYEALSIANQWYPTDPVEKLEATITRYAQIFDVVDTKDSRKLNMFLQMIEHEIKYILSIIGEAKHRTIDLTTSVLLSLEIIQDVHYRSMKRSLAEEFDQWFTNADADVNAVSTATTKKLITRSLADRGRLAKLSHWAYVPIRELLRLISARHPHIQTMADEQFMKSHMSEQQKPLNASHTNNATEGEEAIAKHINQSPTSSSVVDTVFVKAVKFRLYGLMMALVSSLHPDAITDALIVAFRVAICNGDDLAVALLLKAAPQIVLGNSTTTSTTATTGATTRADADAATDTSSFSFESFIQLAAELHFHHIRHRLSQAALSSNSSKQSNPISAAAAAAATTTTTRGADTQNPSKTIEPLASTEAPTVLPIRNEHLHSYPSSIPRGKPKQCKKQLLSALSDGNAHEYNRMKIQAITVHNLTSIQYRKQVDDVLCQVDRISIADISVKQFFREYVSVNRPVILVDDPTNRSPKASKERTNAAEMGKDGDVWQLNALEKRYGSIQQAVSHIPYGSLFGQKEEVLSLADFIAHPMKGMKAFTRRLVEHYLQEISSEVVGCDEAGALLVSASIATPQHGDKGGGGTDNNSSSSTAASTQLPMYIFSGVGQELNEALKPHMFEYVKKFSAAKGAASAGAVRLLDLMQVVRRPNATTTTTLAEQQASPDESSSSSSSSSSEASASTGVFPAAWKTQFFLGPPLSGAPFHHHAPAFNALVHGVKEWQLLPPGLDMYSNQHPLQWLRDGATNATYYPYSHLHDESDTSSASTAAAAGAPRSPTSRTTTTTTTTTPANRNAPQQSLCRVIQHAGEVLFVPRHWTHQVLNLAESVGFAVEISDYYM